MNKKHKKKLKRAAKKKKDKAQAQQQQEQLKKQMNMFDRFPKRVILVVKLFRRLVKPICLGESQYGTRSSKSGFSAHSAWKQLQSL
jgi:hypothetical protein